MSDFEGRTRIADPVRQADAEREERLKSGVAGDGDVTIRDSLGRDLIVSEQYRGSTTAVTAAKQRNQKLGDMKAFQVAEASQKVNFQQQTLEQISYDADAEIISGLLAASVIAEGVSPHANKPGNWNLSTYKTATIDRSFNGFAFPKPIQMVALAAWGEMNAYFAGADEFVFGDEDDGETVIIDDGLSIAPGYGEGTGKRSPIAEVVRDQQHNGISYSIQATAICIEHQGLTALYTKLQELSGSAIFHGLRWSGMLQHAELQPHTWITVSPHIIDIYDSAGQKVGTHILDHSVDAADASGETAPETGDLLIVGDEGVAVEGTPVSFAGRPDPATWIAGNTANTIDNPPGIAIIELFCWSEEIKSTTGGDSNHVWHVVATRTQ